VLSFIGVDYSGDAQLQEVKPPTHGPFSILKRLTVGPILSTRKWKSALIQPSLEPLKIILVSNSSGIIFLKYYFSALEKEQYE
jgi:hypothetical protein